MDQLTGLRPVYGDWSYNGVGRCEQWKTLFVAANE